MSVTTREVIDEWYRRVSVTQRAHYLSANYYSRRRYWLGVPAVALATVVGTSVLASLATSHQIWVQVALGLGSVAAAVLTSLQTFLGYAERAEKHRIAGAKYGALGRDLEILRVCSVLAEERIVGIRERLDDLAIESPDNPQYIYYRAGAGMLEAPGSAR